MGALGSRKLIKKYDRSDTEFEKMTNSLYGELFFDLNTSLFYN